MRGRYPWDFQEYPVDMLLSSKLALSLFLFSTHIPRNILTLVSTLWSLANWGIGSEEYSWYFVIKIRKDIPSNYSWKISVAPRNILCYFFNEKTLLRIFLQCFQKKYTSEFYFEEYVVTARRWIASFCWEIKKEEELHVHAYMYKLISTWSCKNYFLSYCQPSEVIFFKIHL